MVFKIELIDSRTRTYNPHLYLDLYDGFACLRHESYLATDTLLCHLVYQSKEQIVFEGALNFGPLCLELPIAVVTL